MMILTGKTIISALRPPYPYGGEFINQFLFALKLCWFPLLVEHGRRRLRRARACRRRTSSSCSARSTASAASSCSRRSASSRRSSRRSSSPASPAPRSPPTSAPARSARSSTRCRCSASTRSRTSSSRASSRSCSSRPVRRLRAALRRSSAGVLATLTYDAPLGPFWASFFTNASTTDLWGVGPQVHRLRRDRRDRLLLQGHDRVRRRGGRRPRGQPGGRHLAHGRRRVQLRLHARCSWRDRTRSCRSCA